MHQGCLDVVQAIRWYNSRWWPNISDHYGYRRSRCTRWRFKSRCAYFLASHSPFIVFHLQLSWLYWWKCSLESKPSRQFNEAYPNKKLWTQQRRNRSSRFCKIFPIFHVGRPRLYFTISRLRRRSNQRKRISRKGSTSPKRIFRVCWSKE